MKNKLIVIPRSQWSRLRDLYEKQRIYASSYNLLQTFINWIAQNAKVEIQIYALNGDWETDGTYVAKFYNHIYCNTLNDNFQRLLEALNCLDASQGCLIAGYRNCFTSVMEKHFLNCGLNDEQYNAECSFWYHLPQEKALKFQIEPRANVKLKRLQDHHAVQLYNVWAHRNKGSVEFLKLLIRYNDNVGAFDENNNLIAWCLLQPLGSLGVLQVADTHKRQGLGQLVVRYMSKLIASKGLEVTAPVVRANVASRSMFEKLGFKIVDQVYWTIKPNLK